MAPSVMLPAAFQPSETPTWQLVPASVPTWFPTPLTSWSGMAPGRLSDVVPLIPLGVAGPFLALGAVRLSPDWTAPSAHRGLLVRVISAELVEGRDRFAFWCEASMRSGGWTFRTEDRSAGTFGATVDAALIGDAVLSRQAASAYGVTCGPKEVTRSHGPNVLLVAHRSGTVHYRHGDAKVVAQARDLVVTDMTRPMSAAVAPGGSRTFSVPLPYGRL